MKEESISQKITAENAASPTAAAIPAPIRSSPVRSSPIRSMTGFARNVGETADGRPFVLTLKSVNHRYLDLQFHLPSGLDALEMRWRRVLKEHLVRGHIDVRLSLQIVASDTGTQYNRAVVRAYLEAFRSVASEYRLGGQPDLNVALTIPGVWSLENSDEEKDLSDLEEAADRSLLVAIRSLNVMREQEGNALAEELRLTLVRLQAQVEELSILRVGMQQAQVERLDQKMREVLPENSPMPLDRILVEAAMLAERSDVEEELARMRAHIDHFQDLLSKGGELGKKLDFLLQEMTREANTTLSKTGGIANRSMRITELGLAMKSEIEKAREQVQNLE